MKTESDKVPFPTPLGVGVGVVNGSPITGVLTTTLRKRA
jgi:hypothetical protein